MEKVCFLSPCEILIFLKLILHISPICGIHMPLYMEAPDSAVTDPLNPVTSAHSWPIKTSVRDWANFWPMTPCIWSNRSSLLDKPSVQWSRVFSRSQIPYHLHSHVHGNVLKTHCTSLSHYSPSRPFSHGSSPENGEFQCPGTALSGPPAKMPLCFLLWGHCFLFAHCAGVIHCPVMSKQ